MTENMGRSKCCKAEVRISGMPDFLGSKEVCTVSYICLKCNQPCDVLKSKVHQKQNICVAQKSEMIELSVNEDIEIRLTKEGRKIYKEYRKKYRHDPIKKARSLWVRVQLSEFMFIFGSKMSMGANAVIVGNVIRIPKP